MGVVLVCVYIACSISLYCFIIHDHSNHIHFLYMYHLFINYIFVHSTIHA